MSVSKWAYSPKKCDGDFCPGDCDECEKAEEPSGYLIVTVVGYTFNEIFEHVLKINPDYEGFVAIVKEDETILLSKRDIIRIRIRWEV